MEVDKWQRGRREGDEGGVIYSQDKTGQDI